MGTSHGKAVALPTLRALVARKNKGEYGMNEEPTHRQKVDIAYKSAIISMVEKGVTIEDVENKYADILTKQLKQREKEAEAREKADAAFRERYTAESWRLFQENFQAFNGHAKVDFNEKLVDPLTSHKSPNLIDWLKAEMPAIVHPDAINNPKAFLKKLYETHDGQKLTYYFDRATVDADYERSSNRWFSATITLRRA